MGTTLRDILKNMKASKPPRSKQKKGGAKGFMSGRMMEWMENRESMNVATLLPHADFLAEQIKYGFLRQFSTEGEQKWHIRPSGQACVRKEGLKKLGYGEMPKKMNGTFFAGDVAESYGICWALLAGCRLDMLQKEVTIPSGIKGVVVRGHIDGRLLVGEKKLVVDFKSASSYSYNNAGSEEDIWAYKKQLSAYMSSTVFKDKVVGGLLLYINKENWRECKEVFVPPPTSDFIKEWEEHCRLLHTTTKDNLPPKPEWATTKLSTLRKPYPGETSCKTVRVLSAVQCQYCPVVKECHGEDWYLRPGGKPNEWHQEVVG